MALITAGACFWESRDGGETCASHQCDPGSILSYYHMWVEFVVGSFLAQRDFSPGSRILLPP